MQNIIVLHIASLSFKKASGITTSVPSLVAAQNQQDNITTGLVISRGKKPKNWKPKFPVFEYKKEFNETSLKDLPKPFNEIDLVVFHSTYIPIHARIANNLNERQIPYIIVPRGGMTKESQNIKKLKKMVGNKLFFNKMVKNSLAIHCLTKGECEETKGWGKNTFVVGNGIKLPEEYIQDKEQNYDGLIFTFIGRIDLYHKGLDLLIEGCYLAKDTMEKYKGIINIYGPSSKKNKKKLQALINEKNLENIIKLNDPVYDEVKHEILKSTDVFIHTSRFEGHPMSVLEALSFGVPCLLTPGTNMSEEVKIANAGWEVQLSPESISSGIKKAILDMNVSKKNEISSNCRLFAMRHSWDEIAFRTGEKYRNLLLT